MSLHGQRAMVHGGHGCLHGLISGHVVPNSILQNDWLVNQGMLVPTVQKNPREKILLGCFLRPQTMPCQGELAWRARGVSTHEVQFLWLYGRDLHKEKCGPGQFGHAGAAGAKKPARER